MITPRDLAQMAKLGNIAKRLGLKILVNSGDEVTYKLADARSGNPVSDVMDLDALAERLMMADVGKRS